MDEILYLEPDEEITSVIDKIKNAKSTRLGLVVPREATILQSVVNLRLLEREAGYLKKEIAIVTTDKIGRNLAAQIGLAVFNSIEEEKPIFQPKQPTPNVSEVIELDMTPTSQAATTEPENIENAPGVHVHHFQEKPVIWKKHEPPVYRGESKPQENIIKSKLEKPVFAASQNKDQRIIKKLILPIVIVLIILVAIGAFLLLPRATIAIEVPSTDMQKSITLVISNQVKATDTNNNILPGDLLEASNEKKENFVATGQKNIGTKASGTITLYNNLDSNGHNLNSGAQLSSSGKTFILKGAVTIPGAGVSGGSIVPGTIKANIEATDVGKDYNVKAGRFTIIGLSAAQQAGIYGQTTSDMTGGDSRQVQVVSQSDYDNAKTKLIGELKDATNKELQSKIGDKKIVDKAIVDPNPIITSTADVGSEAKNFDMNMKYTQQVMVFDFTQMKSLLLSSLTKQVPPDKMVAIAKDEDIGLDVTKIAYDKGELDINAQCLAKISPKIDTDSIKNNILGRSAASATEFIKTQPNINNITIEYWPKFWLKRLPYISRNVTITVNYKTIQTK